MRGHEPLIAMRRAGRIPGAVWLSLDPDPLESWRNWPEYLGLQWKRFPDAVGSAHVQVEPGESIASLDLRFLVGLPCWVHGTDERRVERLHQACADAGAKRVLSTTQQPDSRGVLRTVAMFDTAGIFEGAC